MEISTDQEVINFKKGEQLANEVVGLLTKESESTEAVVLNDYIANDPNCKELFEILTDEVAISKILSEFKRNEKFEGVAVLKKRLYRIERKRRTRIALSCGLSVACAMIAVIFLLRSPVEKIEDTIVINYEISKPTLILSSGDTINLDDNKNNEIIQGNYEIKNIAESKISSGSNNTVVAAYNTIIVPSKYTYTIVLNDSSEVFLNANSEFKYPVTFTGDRREVFLKGEGYFKVKKSDKPFIVNTTDISVRVYGTTFDINTNLSGVVETVLVSGSVGVKVNGNEDEEVMIKPNEMFTLNRSNGKVDVKDVQAEDHIAWIDGYFSCTKMSLKLFMNQVSAWHGVNFEFNQDSICEMPVSVLRLSRNLELQELLKVVENMAEVEIIKKAGGDYLIK